MGTINPGGSLIKGIVMPPTGVPVTNLTINNTQDLIPLWDESEGAAVPIAPNDLRGNMDTYTTGPFARLWPDYILVVGQQNILGGSGFDNSNGNGIINVNAWAASTKIPAAAKGIIFNVQCGVQSVGTAGTSNESNLSFYNDAGYTTIADRYPINIYEWNNTTAGTSLLAVSTKMFAPIIAGKIYYSVSGSRASQNFDLEICGFWDT